MNIKQISKEIFDNNKAKGFWDEERNVGEMLMLVVSELAEALEAHRKGQYAHPDALIELLSDPGAFTWQNSPTTFQSMFKDHVKDSFEDEIADTVIRLFDISEGLGIDLEWHIRQKLEYNKLRPHKHGKAY